MNRSSATMVVICSLLIGLLVWQSGVVKLPTWVAPVVAPDKPDATKALVVMLYEADHGPLPPHAKEAAAELSAAGREVRMVEDDVLTGLGTVPLWLQPGIKEGRAAMGGQSDEQQTGDALVLIAGGKLLKAIPMPATKEAVMEACK